MPKPPFEMDISGLDDESVDNRCRRFEVGFPFPVNADWLRHVLHKALEQAMCLECRERWATSPPDFGDGLCNECRGHRVGAPPPRELSLTDASDLPGQISKIEEEIGKSETRRWFDGIRGKR